MFIIDTICANRILNDFPHGAPMRTYAPGFVGLQLSVRMLCDGFLLALIVLGVAGKSNL